MACCSFALDATAARGRCLFGRDFEDALSTFLPFALRGEFSAGLCIRVGWALRKSKSVARLDRERRASASSLVCISADLS